jgi:hypothetical protein
MATKYRCYLLDQDRISAVHVIEGEDDAAAMLEADRILAASSFTTAEVWDRERKVSIISRKEEAAE